MYAKSLQMYLHVAPYVGAWIETSKSHCSKSSVLSHPMWVRGLKPITEVFPAFESLSHPMWVRGLKHTNITKNTQIYCVAPYVGAWIETK